MISSAAFSIDATIKMESLEEVNLVALAVWVALEDLEEVFTQLSMMMISLVIRDLVEEEAFKALVFLAVVSVTPLDFQNR